MPGHMVLPTENHLIFDSITDPRTLHWTVTGNSNDMAAAPFHPVAVGSTRKQAFYDRLDSSVTSQ